MTVALDSDQQKAAAHRTGTAAVAAAAGSGKTTLLVGRAIALVEAGVQPESVMTLAFNRNAAETLRQRFAAHPATAQAAKGMASTFHAFALSMCRLVLPRLAVLGLRAEDDAAQQRNDAAAPQRTAWDLGRAAWEEMGGRLYGDSRPAHLRGVELEELMKAEPGVRERLFSAGWPALADKPLSVIEKAIDDLKLEEQEVSSAALAEFAVAYRKQRRASNAVDFTDMLLGLGHYLRVKEPRVMARLAKFQHLQVDEAQDGNELRWFIARTFADLGGGRSVMAVGDLRQSIAGFAGAQPKLFRAWWDGADAQFTLPRNYRSAAAIVEAGNAVAKGESWNVGGDSVAAREDLGPGLVRVGPVGSLAIAQEVGAALRNGDYGHKDVTVLSRTRAALETVAFGLRTQGIRVVVRGGGNVWASMDGRMVRAYLDLAERKVRDLSAATLAFNRPRRYVSRAKLQTWLGAEGQLNRRLLDDSNSYRPAEALVDAMEELASLAWADRVAQVEEWLIEGLSEDEVGDASAPGADSDKADLYRNLCEIARTCGSVANLDVAIAADAKVNPKDPDVVELSTIHQAKGDQWGTVYVAIKDRVFPSPRARTEEAQAEEVRLLYVAVTRPVHTLVVDLQGGGFPDKVAALQEVAARSQAAIQKAEPVEAPMPAPEAAVERVEPSHMTPPGGALNDPNNLHRALLRDQTRAEALTVASSNKPRPGERFVPVRWAELEELLVPLAFVEDETLQGRAGQRVLAATLSEGSRLLVYTSVPPGAETARELGDDSMKVVLLLRGRPMGKQTYVARTRNWRNTLLTRLQTALEQHPDVLKVQTRA